jgi:3-methyladenine DNA glycosylase AlkD
MNAGELFSDVHAYCVSCTNEENIKKYSKYFKGDFDAYGLSQPQINERTKEILKRKDFGLEVLIKAAPLLFKTGKYEETSFALLLFNGLHKQYTYASFEVISGWFSKSIYNWAHADALGMFILPKFLLKSIVTMDDFRPWLNSPYKFQRRCVPVTFIKLLKTDIEFTELFRFIEPLMTDPEREVHQGTGWFLREAWKKKPEETEAFLLKWKDISPRLIFQYACERMTPENKLRFKKVKA